MGSGVVIEEGKKFCVYNDGIDVGMSEDIGYVFMLEAVVDGYSYVSLNSKEDWLCICDSHTNIDCSCRANPVYSL